MKFWVTFFDDIYARSCIGREVNLDELAEIIRNTTAADKAHLPLLKMARFGSARTPPNPDGSGGGSLRHDANVLTVSGAECDYDGETMPFQEALDRLDGAGIAYLAYTSPRYTLAKPRWRVLLPSAKPLTPAERTERMDWLNGLLGGGLALESWGISQSFYYGHVDGAPFEIVVNDVDECIDEATELALGAQPYRPPAAAATGGVAGKPNYAQLDELQLRELIKSGKSYYHASSELLWRWAQQGVSQADAQHNIETAFDDMAPASRDRKWGKCRTRIAVWVVRTYERAAKAAAKQTKGRGRPLVFEARKPWPQSVDGDALLDELVSTCRSYVVMPEPAARAVALWIIHTYVFLAVMITPRLELKSPQKRCGKSTLLTIIGCLASRAMGTANISAAALYRTVEQAQPTLLVDEADTFLGENEELRGVLNAGYMRGGQVIRTIGDDHEPRVFSCWSPVAVATIRKLPDTIEDRAIAIVMTRRLQTEPVTRLRLDRLSQLAPLASKIQRWADDNVAAIEAADPEIPDSLNDRAADCWRVLLAIADCIGGEWPQRARTAAVLLSSDNDDIETVGTQLLADLRDLFAEKKQDEVFSSEIVDALGAMEERPWAEWGRRREPITKTQLARLLAHFKIRPTGIHRGSQHAKGYARAAFDDAFARYLP
jgi:putative DNA primase/helicase